MKKWNRGLWALGVAAAGAYLMAGVASAALVTTEQGGSVLIYPKVVWAGNCSGSIGRACANDGHCTNGETCVVRDTIIQITNTGNPMVHAHCFYVDASPFDPFSPPSVINPPRWVEIDFHIWLTKQQPTHWVASLGRRVNFNDPFGSDGAGLDPGLIPPLPFGFRGELKCIEVDDGGVPYRSNKLKGEATLRSDTGDVSKYNAIALVGNTNLDVQLGDATELFLNFTADNPDGEYSACPDVLILNHFADGVSDPALGNTLTADCDSVCVSGPTPGQPCGADIECGFGGRCLACPILTNLTLMPCQQDFENQIPGRVTVQFQIFNEFEQPFSTSTTVDCWLDAPLSAIGAPGPANPFSYRVLGTIGAVTRINPNPGNGGVIGIAEEVRFDTYSGDNGNGSFSPETRAAYNIHVEGNRYDRATDGRGNPEPGVTDRIIVPEQF